ncbi:hypothetical protein ACNKHT_20800 [Shigella flexneri]
MTKNVKVVGEPPENEACWLLSSSPGSRCCCRLVSGFFFMRQMQGGGGKGAMSFGKSKARMLTED